MDDRSATSFLCPLRRWKALRRFGAADHDDTGWKVLRHPRRRLEMHRVHFAKIDTTLVGVDFRAEQLRNSAGMFRAHLEGCLLPDLRWRSRLWPLPLQRSSRSTRQSTKRTALESRRAPW